MKTRPEGWAHPVACLSVKKCQFVPILRLPITSRPLPAPSRSKPAPTGTPMFTPVSARPALWAACPAAAGLTPGCGAGAVCAPAVVTGVVPVVVVAVVVVTVVVVVVGGVVVVVVDLQPVCAGLLRPMPLLASHS